MVDRALDGQALRVTALHELFGNSDVICSNMELQYLLWRLNSVIDPAQNPLTVTTTRIYNRMPNGQFGTMMDGDVPVEIPCGGIGVEFRVHMDPEDMQPELCLLIPTFGENGIFEGELAIYFSDVTEAKLSAPIKVRKVPKKYEQPRYQ
jgi:hypothetical protein